MGAAGAARDLGRPQGVRREHPRSGAVTDEQRCGRPKDLPFEVFLPALALPCFVFLWFCVTPLRAFMRWLLERDL